MVHAFFLAGFEVYDLVVKSEGTLLSDRLKNFQIGIAEWDGIRAIDEAEDAEDFTAVDERTDECGCGKCGGGFGLLRRDNNRFAALPALADQAGTIGYEILTGLGPRYLRRYTGGAA